MAILYAGTSIADVNAAPGWAANTSGTNVRTSFVREGIGIQWSAGYPPITIDFNAIGDFWFSFHGFWLNYTSVFTGPVLRFFNKSYSLANALFQLDMDSAATCALEYWDGAAYQEAGAEVLPPPITIITRYDCHVKIDDAGGEISIYEGGALKWQMTGDTKLTAATTCDRVELWGFGNSTVAFSQFLLADEDTRAFEVCSLAPTADGANTAWDGAFGDIDETGRGLGDYIASDVANEIETFVIGDIPAAAAGTLARALIIATDARKGTSGPQNLQGAVRLSGTDYFSANLVGVDGAALDGGPKPVQAIWELNPATAAPWTQAAINGAEIGVKSIA